MLRGRGRVKVKLVLFGEGLGFRGIAHIQMYTRVDDHFPWMMQ